MMQLILSNEQGVHTKIKDREMFPTKHNMNSVARPCEDNNQKPWPSLDPQWKICLMEVKGIGCGSEPHFLFAGQDKCGEALDYTTHSSQTNVLRTIS